MANTEWGPATGPTGNLTRPHWAGEWQDIDIHLEDYTNQVDSAFDYRSVFTALTSERQIQDNTQTLRIDRMNIPDIAGRRSGEKLEPQRVANDKMIVIVDTVLYARIPMDWQDIWTAPDRKAELSRGVGIQFAKTYDNAHIIQAIKARNWVAPAHLKPAFSDGIEVQVTVAANATTEAQLEANAVMLNLAHRDCIDELIVRDIPLEDMITLVSTKYYSQLIEHPKLLNILYGKTNDDGFKQRRVVTMNGIPVMEFLQFPKATDVGVAHPLGNQFDVTADDVKCQMVTLSRNTSLITARVRPIISNFWQDDNNFSMVLDTYTMYNIAARRPDTIAVVSITEA